MHCTSILFSRISTMQRHSCCCVQNMELTVAQCNNASAEIAAANHPFIRIAQVRMESSKMSAPQVPLFIHDPFIQDCRLQPPPIIARSYLLQNNHQSTPML